MIASISIFCREPDDRRVFDVGRRVVGLLRRRDVVGDVELEIARRNGFERLCGAGAVGLEQLRELVMLDDDPLWRQLRSELDAFDGLLVSRVGTADEEPAAALAKHDHLILGGKLAIDHIARKSLRIDRRQDQTTAMPARSTSVWARSVGDTAPAAMTAATNPIFFSLSFELRTRSFSDSWPLSLPACTRTRATPDRDRLRYLGQCVHSSLVQSMLLKRGMIPGQLRTVDASHRWQGQRFIG